MEQKEVIRVNSADTPIFKFDVKTLLAYKDLIYMFVKRYFAALYKQTVLGPAWVVVNPLLTTLMFTVVFGNIANLSTDGVPSFVFYLSGNTLWLLFSSTLTNISSTFTTNRDVFSKVYFPRMTMPISSVLCSFINFGVQFLVYVLVYLGFLLFGQTGMQPTIYLLAVPLLVLLVALLGMGCGLIVTALTTRYKDLNVLVSFAVQLWMFLTPIVYPASSVGGLAKTIIMLNPMSPLTEAFRFAFTGAGDWSWLFLGISAGITLLLFFGGIVLFNKAEKTFVDTI